MATAVHPTNPQRVDSRLGDTGADSLPFAPDDFPLLPHGQLLWADAAANVVELSELASQLPDCLVTLSGPSKNGAALIVDGAVVDAVCVERSTGLLGDRALAALMEASEGTISGYGIEDRRLTSAIPLLWRYPRLLTGLPAEWLDIDRLLRSIRSEHRSCALLIQSSVRGAALFSAGELVATYTERRRRPSSTNATLRALLRTPGARITVVGDPEGSSAEAAFGGLVGAAGTGSAPDLPDAATSSDGHAPALTAASLAGPTALGDLDPRATAVHLESPAEAEEAQAAVDPESSAEAEGAASMAAAAHTDTEAAVDMGTWAAIEVERDGGVAAAQTTADDGAAAFETTVDVGASAETETADDVLPPSGPNRGSDTTDSEAGRDTGSMAGSGEPEAIVENDEASAALTDDLTTAPHQDNATTGAVHSAHESDAGESAVPTWSVRGQGDSDSTGEAHPPDSHPTAPPSFFETFFGRVSAGSDGPEVSSASHAPVSGNGAHPVGEEATPPPPFLTESDDLDGPVSERLLARFPADTAPVTVTSAEDNPVPPPPHSTTAPSSLPSATIFTFDSAVPDTPDAQTPPPTLHDLPVAEPEALEAPERSTISESGEALHDVDENAGESADGETGLSVAQEPKAPLGGVPVASPAAFDDDAASFALPSSDVSQTFPETFVFEAMSPFSDLKNESRPTTAEVAATQAPDETHMAQDIDDFVPTRLDIDVEGLRKELVDIATVWLGADDIGPAAQLIMRARPGVDEFVATIAAIGALQIPGHETAVVRAMAREMHFRAAEVLCGV